MLREFLIEGAKGSQPGDFSKLEEKFAEIDSEFLSEFEEINLYDIGAKIRYHQIEDMKKLIKDLEVPEKGRLQYKLMPPEIKKAQISILSLFYLQMTNRYNGI